MSTKNERHFNDNRPITWVCECGQVNLLTDQTCFACHGKQDECWDEEDKKGMIVTFYQSEYSEEKGRFTGHKTWLHEGTEE